mgnify:CR=1 FL=1
MTTRCMACGADTDSSLCWNCLYGKDQDWAQVNRIMSNMLHRKVVPERLALKDREEE